MLSALPPLSVFPNASVWSYHLHTSGTLVFLTRHERLLRLPAKSIYKSISECLSNLLLNPQRISVKIPSKVASMWQSIWIVDPWLANKGASVNVYVFTVAQSYERVHTRDWTERVCKKNHWWFLKIKTAFMSAVDVDLTLHIPFAVQLTCCD